VATLFISDLHLHPSRPAILACFLGFLEQQQGRAEAIYILGDLFEAWIGDDDPEPVYAPVRAGLRRCVSAGTPVYVMRGNRDFLIGERFGNESGCRLIADPTRIELYGVPTLLMHGDALCTDDRDYQAMRQRLRDPHWQRQVLALPVAARRELATRARELSTFSNQNKDDHIMDVNQDEVLRTIRARCVDLLIHGHTHRPAAHRLQLGERQVTRIDLGNWYSAGRALVVDAAGWRWLEVDCPG
jgi:UDP-2,3-diacylglucosamine hydrolase